MEKVAQTDQIDIFYADESGFSEEGYVPYGWQFRDERVSIPAQKGQSVNCFALISRQCKCHFTLSESNIDAQFIEEYMDAFSLQIRKPTVVVLDNARVHTAHKIKERLGIWQQRGLYIFYLPPYSPQLNLAEILWKHAKGYWLRPQDYQDWQLFRLRLWICMASVGTELFIQFAEFKF